jgi:hypothetical protein
MHCFSLNDFFLNKEEHTFYAFLIISQILLSTYSLSSTAFFSVRALQMGIDELNELVGG